MREEADPSRLPTKPGERDSVHSNNNQPVRGTCSTMQQHAVKYHRWITIAAICGVMAVYGAIFFFFFLRCRTALADDCAPTVCIVRRSLAPPRLPRRARPMVYQRPVAPWPRGQPQLLDVANQT